MSHLSPFKLGLFVLVVIALGAVALVWVGAARVFESSQRYAAFFDEPVTGLRPGAAVEHLGVRIGRVDSVDLAPGDRVVQVIVEVRSGFRLDPSMALGIAQAGITGSPFLALDEAPPQDRREVAHPPTRDPVLATRPGGGGLGALQKKLASIDVEGLVSAWQAVARDADGILRRGDGIARDLETATRSLKVATAAVQRQVDSVRPGAAGRIATRIEATTGAGERAARSLDENVGASLALVREDLARLKQAVAEAEALARSLREEPGRVIERGGGNDPFKK